MLMADWRDSAPGLLTTRGEVSGAAVQTEAGVFKCSVREIFLIIKKGLRAVDDSETRTAVRRLRRIEITTKP